MVDTPQQLPAIPPGEWNYIGTLTAPPSTGQVRLDNATQTAATHMWINKTDAMSNDASANLASIAKAMEITLANKSDGTKWQTYAVTGTPVDGGTYVDYPVVWKRGGGVIPAQRTIMTAVTVVTTVAVSGLSMQASAGTSTLKLGQGVAVTMPCLTAHAGRVEVSGQLMTFDYFHPFEGPHLTSPGLTIRQWYAGQALMGFAASTKPAANLIGKVSEYCFKVADSMIAYEAKQAAGVKSPAVPRPPLPAPAAPPQSAPATVTPAEVEAMQRKNGHAA